MQRDGQSPGAGLEQEVLPLIGGSVVSSQMTVTALDLWLESLGENS